MLFDSFLDEMQKIAARKLTRSQMLEALDRFRPTEKSFNRMLMRNPDIDKVRRSYRGALQIGDETLEVPLAERLRNYKEIKRTGQMPRIDDLTDYDFGVVAGEPSGFYMNLSDKAPVEMFSGGKVESLKRAVKNPKTRSNTDVLVPGRLRTERGLYFTPSRASARSYSEMPREADRVVGTTGKPAILSAKLPRRRVITNAPDAADATEAFIAAKDLKKAKTKISHLLRRTQ